ncbi:nudix hydrolase 24, chloroplastic [Galendromus occidentalis]|uniref:Nudix hydrolase 24, chloroplastic n=1 Tax=Galendromus occidentalis TaxID=34638 RepID=A0AAJ6VZD3_9ACAR|nr:nudix hydrolase 24, chloroplastic [Galendromus occidentalis]
MFEMSRVVSESEVSALNSFLRIFKPDYTSRSVKFFVNAEAVGFVHLDACAILAENASGFFRIEESKNEIHFDSSETSDGITGEIARRLHRFRERNLFPCLRGWREEMLEVSRVFGGEPLFAIERSATPLFGIKRYGVHINGFVEKDGKIDFVWLQRRSRTKQQFPGVLDIIVSGGLQAGSTPLEAAHRECFEEATMTDDLCKEHLKSVGSVSFLYEDELGLHPLTFFCYDASLPVDFEPRANDGEVENFVKFPVDDLLDLIRDPERFKVTSAPTVLDFLIRHHVIDSSYGSALMNIASTVHQNLQEDYPE